MGEAQYLFIPSAIAKHPTGCENLMLEFQATVEGATRPERRGTAVAKITVHPVQPGDTLPDTVRWPSSSSVPSPSGLHPDAGRRTPTGFTLHKGRPKPKAFKSKGMDGINALHLCPPAGVPGVPGVPTTSSAPTSQPTEAPIAVPGVPGVPGVSGVPGSKEAKLEDILHTLDTVALASEFNISLVDQGSFDSFGPSKSVTENLTYLKASTATRKPPQGQLKSPVAQWDLSSLIYSLPSGRLQHTQRSP